MEIKEELIKLIKTSIYAQYSLIPIPIEIKNQELLNDKFFLGYIFGFTDGLLSSYDLYDEDLHINITIAVCVHLLGLDIGIEAFYKIVEIQKESYKNPGIMQGGQDAINLLNGKTPSLGLTKHYLFKD